MTQVSRFWDGTTVGDAAAAGGAPYDAANEFARVMQSVSGGGGIATNLGGVFRGELNELAVTGAATPVSINTGRGISAGTWYENDAATTIAIPTPAASTRVDVIVMRKDWAAQTVRLVRVAGVEGAGVPAITQVYGTTWDTPLANVSITTGGVITLTDRRQFLGAGPMVNIRTFAIGDLLYADTTTTLARLANVATGSILASNGVGAPLAWTSSPTISGTLSLPGNTAHPIDGIVRIRQNGATRYRWDLSVGGATATFTAFDDTGGVYIGVTYNGLSHTFGQGPVIISNGGSNAAPVLRINGEASTGWYSPASTAWAWSSAGTMRVYFAAAGLVGINQATDAFMTQGLVIQQGGADNEILALKSTDVAHGMTSLAETDTYGAMQKQDAANGGLAIFGYGGTQALTLYGRAVTTDTAKNTAALAAIRTLSVKKSGTSVTVLGATENVFAITDGTSTRFIFQGDGTSYEDVGTAWTNYDDHDDIALLTDLSIAASRADDAIHERFASFLRYSPEMLQAMDLIHFNADGHHFANRSKIQMALIGASRQLGERAASVEQRVEALEAENRELRELLEGVR